MPFLKGISNNYQFQINTNFKSLIGHWKLEIGNWKFQSAFTLIELLIVISIIGILASLTLASYSGAQQKARDGIRKSDLAQMKRALELVKADCKGAAYYPIIPNTSSVDHYNKLGAYLTNSNLKYISSTPKDPKDTSPYQYEYKTSDGSTILDKCPSETSVGAFDKDGADNYSLWVKLERTSDADAAASRLKCFGKPGPKWTDPGETPTTPGTNTDYAGYYVICNN